MARNELPLKLVVFDGDDTLWNPLDGLFLSDRTPDDTEGFPSFVFRALPDSPGVIERNDGARFALNEDAIAVLTALRRAGILIAVASYNHLENVKAALDAFGIAGLFDYVVAEWHTNKDEMLRKLVEAARRNGKMLAYSQVLLMDDDMYGLYANQCRAIGARFACYGKDLRRLADLLPLAGIEQL